MKKFLSFISIAIVMTLMASAMLLIPTAAETEVVNSKNVVFISDAVKDLAAGMTQAQAVATYDGSSADKPLYPTPVQTHELKENADKTVGRYYLNTALYQAAEKLLDTGGTIVICGPVRIDDDDAYGSSLYNKDFEFPESDRRITITNVYNDIDYRTTNSARLEIGGAVNLLLGSPVTMEHIKINCTTAGRLICAQGNDLVMGEGITNDLPSVANGNGWFYPSIVGGKRFGDLDSDTSVTIKSGSYGFVSGSSWGNNMDNPSCQNGDVNLNLLGGTYTSFISGISARRRILYATEADPDLYESANYSSVYVNGDINITIGGSAVFRSYVYAVSPACFGEAGHSVYIKVLGGFGNGKLLVKEWTASTFPEGTGIAPERIVLDMSDANLTDAVLNDMINQNKNAMQILYPAKWLQTYTVNTYPSNSTVFKGDSVTSKGASLTLNFKNLKDNATTYTQTVTYDGKVAAFKAECDTSENGTATTSYKYGTKEYHTEKTTVVQTPDVSILGARLRITESDNADNSQEQTLRFVANYTANGVTVTDKGVLVVKAYMLSSPDKLNFENTYGMFVCNPAPGAEYAAGAHTNFECDYTSINQKEFNTDYYARAYVKFMCDGKEYVKYSDVITRNPYTIALQATQDSSSETDKAKGYLRDNLITVFDNYSPTTQYTSDKQLESLRNTVVAYMELQANIEWMPAETFAFYNDLNVSVNDDGSLSIVGSDQPENGVRRKAIYEAGKTYKGIPYASSGWLERRTTNVEHFTSLLEGSGTVKTLPMTLKGYDSYNTLTPFVKTICSAFCSSSYHPHISDCVGSLLIGSTSRYFSSVFTDLQLEAAYQNYRMFPGSHCSQAVFTSWNNIIDNKATVSRLASTSNMVPGHNTGVLPVGCYVFTETTLRSDTNQIAQQLNAKEDMYESYDQLKPGDALIHYGYDSKGNGSGHTRLVLSVDTENMKVKTLECANWDAPQADVTSNGGAAESYDDLTTNWLELEYTYDYLISDGFLPITIEELRTGLSDVESVILTDVDLGECLAAGTLEGWVKSNKSIDAVRPIIKDMNGTVIYDYTSYLLDEARHVSSFDLGELDLSFALESGTKYMFSFEVNTATSTDNVPIVTDYVFTAK